MSSFLLHTHSPVSVEVNYRVDESSFIDSVYTGNQKTTGGFDRPTGTNQYFTKKIDIPLLNNSAGMGTFGEVTVTLLNANVGNNPGYLVATNDSENSDLATVNVISVSTGIHYAIVDSDRNTVKEGEEIIFNISIIPALQQDVRVRLKVSQQGSFIPWALPESIMVPPSGAMLRIQTVDTDQVENGMVTVEVVEGQRYRSGRSKSVMIADNGISIPKYSVVDSVIKSILLQSVSERNIPGSQALQSEISIRAVNEIVEEGQPAEFVISGIRNPIAVPLSMSA